MLIIREERQIDCNEEEMTPMALQGRLFADGRRRNTNTNTMLASTSVESEQDTIILAYSK